MSSFFLCPTSLDLISSKQIPMPQAERTLNSVNGMYLLLLLFLFSSFTPSLLVNSHSHNLILHRHHWIVGNISGSQVKTGDILSGYVGAGPPEKTGIYSFSAFFFPFLLILFPSLTNTNNQQGLHRYIFILARQPSGKIDYSAVHHFSSTAYAIHQFISTLS